MTDAQKEVLILAKQIFIENTVPAAEEPAILDDARWAIQAAEIFYKQRMKYLEEGK
jgi:hypothetical protein